jgi:ABC-type amino acid transport system permease subunit
MSPSKSDLRQEKQKMERYLLIELNSDGLAFETAQFDFYASWLGIGLVIAIIIGLKTVKKYKRNK